MKQHIVLSGIASIFLAALVLLVNPASTVHAARAAQCAPIPGTTASTPGYVSGSAYALDLSVGGMIGPIKTGPLFPVTLGCEAKTNQATNGVSSLALQDYINLAALRSDVVISRSANNVKVAEISRVGGLSLFGGMIRADAVTASSTTQGTTFGASSINTSTFFNLIIAGHKFEAAPPPNLSYGIPGVGTVTLNEQTSTSNTPLASDISVTAIDIEMAFPNVLGIPAGGRLRVAHVEGSFVRSPETPIQEPTIALPSSRSH